MKKVVLLFLVIVAVYGCEPYWKIRKDYLLPKNCKLEPLNKTKEEGVFIYNVYQIFGEINVDSLSSYPKDIQLKGDWEVITKWHKLSHQELTNLKSFFKKEKINPNISNEIIKSIELKDNYFISYTYDKDKTPLSKKEYKTHNWMELYYLNPNDKKLIHILYGMF